MHKKKHISAISLIWLFAYLLMVGQQLWHHHHTDGSSCLSFACQEQTMGVQPCHHQPDSNDAHSLHHRHLFPAHHFCCYADNEEYIANSQRQNNKKVKSPFSITYFLPDKLCNTSNAKGSYFTLEEDLLAPAFYHSTHLLRAPPLV